MQSSRAGERFAPADVKIAAATQPHQFASWSPSGSTETG